VVAELAGVDGVHLDPVQLQRQHRGFVPHIPWDGKEGVGGRTMTS
jgi:hypothetical protein